MKIRRIVALVTVSLLAAIVCAAGNLEVKRFVLFAGAIDSTANRSRWIDVKRSERVYIRAFSTHATFGGADSTTVDSIATFAVLFSDSTTVWSGATAGLDSVQLSGNTVPDSTKLVAVVGGLVNKALRGPGNGWGVWCQIIPTGSNGNTVPLDGQLIMTEAMRVVVTPVRRSTGATVSATVPNRTNGIPGFRLEAYVVRRYQ